MQSKQSSASSEAIQALQESKMASSQKKAAPVLSSDVRKALDELDTTSAKIRFLAKRKFSAGDIKRTLNISHQHAYNVMHQPFKGEVK
jgi:glutaredoxin 2